MKAPCLQGSVVGSDCGGISVAPSRNAGHPICAPRKNEQILYRAALQHPRDVKLSFASLPLPRCVVQDGLEIPTSDEKVEYVVGIGKLWRSLRRHESIQKTL